MGVEVLGLDELRATYAPTPTTIMITTITMIIAAAAIALFLLTKFGFKLVKQSGY